MDRAAPGRGVQWERRAVAALAETKEGLAHWMLLKYRDATRWEVRAGLCTLGEFFRFLEEGDEP